MTRTPILSLKGVSFAFPQGDSVLQDLSLNVSPGEFVSILGPSGCGKSTLLNLAAGLLSPIFGEVHFGGRRLAGVNTAVGYMTQDDTLLPWRTTWQNVALPLLIRRRTHDDRMSRDEIKAKVAELLRLMRLEDSAKKFPAQLSGGMKRRALLARSLVASPKMLLMDEPFAALDAQLAAQLQGELRRTVEAIGQTVLFVTHDISESVLVSDRVVVLGVPDGRVVGDVPVPLGTGRDMSALRGTSEYVAIDAELRELLLHASAPDDSGVRVGEP